MEDILNELNAAANGRPWSPHAAESYASALLEVGEYRRAQIWLEKAREKGGDNPSVYTDLAKALIAIGSHEEACRQLETGISKHPSNIGLRLFLANLYATEAEDWPRASAIFCGVIADAPSCRPAFNALAAHYIVNATLDTATRRMTALLRTDRTSLIVNEALCLALEQYGRYSELGDYCSNLLISHSDSILLYILRARSHVALGRIDEATNDYVASCHLAAQDEMAIIELLRHLLRMGRWHEAQSTFRTILARAGQRVVAGHLEWDGTEVPGTILLIDNVTGFGDLIQFSRFARLAEERGMRVIVRSPLKLYRLLSRIPGISVVAHRYTDCPAYHYRTQASLLGLLLARNFEELGACVPYIDVSTAAGNRQQAELGNSDAILRVGLCWSGTSMWQTDPYRARSIPFAQFRLIA